MPEHCSVPFLYIHFNNRVAIILVVELLYTSPEIVTIIIMCNDKTFNYECKAICRAI